MQELEKILEEIEQRKARAEKLIVKPPHDKLDQVANDTAETFIEAYKECQDIIRKHMNDGWIPVDKNNVPDHEILACDRYKNELIGYLNYNADSEEFVCESDECIMYQVIAWMEKPEPYRPERSGE